MCVGGGGGGVSVSFSRLYSRMQVQAWAERNVFFSLLGDNGGLWKRGLDIT
jgi:hypothetical protein